MRQELKNLEERLEKMLSCFEDEEALTSLKRNDLFPTKPWNTPIYLLVNYLIYDYFKYCSKNKGDLCIRPADNRDIEKDANIKPDNNYVILFGELYKPSLPYALVPVVLRSFKKLGEVDYKVNNIKQKGIIFCNYKRRKYKIRIQTEPDKYYPKKERLTLHPPKFISN